LRIDFHRKFGRGCSGRWNGRSGRNGHCGSRTDRGGYKGRGRGGHRGLGMGDNTEEVASQPPKRPSKYIYFLIA